MRFEPTTHCMCTKHETNTNTIVNTKIMWLPRSNHLGVSFKFIKTFSEDSEDITFGKAVVLDF